MSPIRRFSTILLAATALGLPAAPAATAGPVHGCGSSVPFTSGTEGYDTFRIPAVVRAANGALVAFAEGRRDSAGDSGAIRTVSRTSRDGGCTWGPLSVVDSNGDATAGNPTPVLARDGELVLLTVHNGLVSEKQIMSGQASDQDTRRVFVLRSRDNGRTWSPARDITADAKRAGLAVVRHRSRARDAAAPRPARRPDRGARQPLQLPAGRLTRRRHRGEVLRRPRPLQRRRRPHLAHRLHRRPHRRRRRRERDVGDRAARRHPLLLQPQPGLRRRAPRRRLQRGRREDAGAAVPGAAVAVRDEGRGQRAADDGAVAAAVLGAGRPGHARGDAAAAERRPRAHVARGTHADERAGGLLRPGAGRPGARPGSCTRRARPVRTRRSCSSGWVWRRDSSGTPPRGGDRRGRSAGSAGPGTGAVARAAGRRRPRGRAGRVRRAERPAGRSGRVPGGLHDGLRHDGGAARPPGRRPADDDRDGPGGGPASARWWRSR